MVARRAMAAMYQSLLQPLESACRFDDVAEVT